MAPTLFASRNALPLSPEDGAELRLRRPGASFVAPTLFASRHALPLSPGDGAGLAWGGPALRLVDLSETPLARKTLAAGSSRQNRSRGFTLIELLVALSVMALLAVLSWRGLDGMARAQAQTSQRADEVLSLQAGLAQWKVDLDALTQTPLVDSLDWDGRVLRLTRTATANDGLVVVAWTRRGDAGGQWLRWQSPLVRTFGNWTDAWSRATIWAQNASVEDRAREVLVAPLQEWQIFYFIGNAWTNPLSSVGSGAAATQAGQPTFVPDGIRLAVTLPPGQAISGKLTLDWVRPTLGGERS